jgi:hypothetical protein
MSPRSAVLGFVLSLVVGAGEVGAEVFRNAPARPLLVMTTHAEIDYPPIVPLPSEENLSALFVFANRTLIQSFNHAPELGEQGSQISSHVRGRVPAADWNALISAMVEAGIDTAQSCRIVPVGLPSTQTVSKLVIRWYGREGRTNTFELSFGPGSGPVCDLAVLELLGAITQAAVRVVAAPTSEYFSVP